MTNNSNTVCQPIQTQYALLTESGIFAARWRNQARGTGMHMLQNLTGRPTATATPDEPGNSVGRDGKTTCGQVILLIYFPCRVYESKAVVLEEMAQLLEARCLLVTNISYCRTAQYSWESELGTHNSTFWTIIVPMI